MRSSPSGTGSVTQPLFGFDAFSDAGWIVDAAIFAGVFWEEVFVVWVDEGVGVTVVVA